MSCKMYFTNLATPVRVRRTCTLDTPTLYMVYTYIHIDVIAMFLFIVLSYCLSYGKRKGEGVGPKSTWSFTPIYGNEYGPHPLPQAILFHYFFLLLFFLPIFFVPQTRF